MRERSSRLRQLGRKSNLPAREGLVRRARQPRPAGRAGLGLHIVPGPRSLPVGALGPVSSFSDLPDMSSLASLPPLIAVDWGSTHFRAKLVLGGAVEAKRSAADGIRHLAGRSCESILESHCAAWKNTHPDARVLISGMVGAREGWREVPYVMAPCDLDALATGVVSVPSAVFGEVWLVPGVRYDDPATGQTDVMRGEETQVLGRLANLPRSGAILSLPGTHSKWVLCREGRIEAFRTWMTGEAFERLTSDSLISGDGSPAEPDSPAFRAGIEAASSPGGWLHQLFQARTRMLTGRLAASEMRSFVSGLLVGHELAEALRFAAGLPIVLLGDSLASTAIAAGLSHLGQACQAEADEGHLRGLLAIAAAKVGKGE